MTAGGLGVAAGAIEGAGVAAGGGIIILEGSTGCAIGRVYYS